MVRWCLCYGMVLFVFIFPVKTLASIPDFFDELFTEFEAEYYSFRRAEYLDFCSSHDLDSSDADNRRTFLRIYFLHDLMTTVSASNCARGGFLRIPYFWHWRDPNPRHAILSLPDSTLLTTLDPPATYKRYATFADIDRVPALYLGDLVADAPGYFHPGCGSFFTFGWCSEREMSFTALFTAWGFQVKIWQTGIHTYSIVWCEFTKLDGAAVVLEAIIDNTFDSVEWRRVPPSTELRCWFRDMGSGAEIGWYNQKARSEEQIEALRDNPVGDAAKNRIRKMVQEAIVEDK